MDAGLPAKICNCNEKCSEADKLEKGLNTYETSNKDNLDSHPKEK